MSQTEILRELKKLSPKERFRIIETVLHQLQEEFQQLDQPIPRLSKKQQLAKAAEVLLKDYNEDEELTSFTALDGEAIHG
jgi:hypothetical protein